MMSVQERRRTRTAEDVQLEDRILAKVSTNQVSQFSNVFTSFCGRFAKWFDKLETEF